MDLLNKCLGAIVASAAMILFWCVAYAGLSMPGCLTGPHVIFDVLDNVIVFLAAAIAGFTFGLVSGPEFRRWQVILGCFVMGVALFAFNYQWLGLPQNVFMTLISVPTLGIMSLNRGDKLRLEKKWAHLAWLVLLCVVLFVACAAIRALSYALDPHWPIN